MRSVIHLSLINIVMSIIILNRNGGGDCNNDLFTPACCHMSRICDAVFGPGSHKLYHILKSNLNCHSNSECVVGCNVFLTSS